MSDWVTLSQDSGIGETIINVSVPSYDFDRTSKYIVSDGHNEVELKIMQGNASPYFTVWYDIPYPDVWQIMANGLDIKKIRVDDGIWVNSAYSYNSSLGRMAYKAENYYHFYSPGVHKIDYVSGDEETVPDGCFHFGYTVYPDYSVWANNHIFKVNIPGEYKTIKQSAFRDCPITTLKLNEGIEKISSFSFLHTRLNEVIIPDSVLSMSDGSTDPPGAFCENDNLETIVFSPNTYSVMASECPSLTSAIIPEGCINLGSFKNCISLRTLVLPSTIESVYTEENLDGCINLQKIYCYASIAPGVGNTDEREGFKDLRPYGELHYPYGSDYSSWMELLPSTWTGINDL